MASSPHTPTTAGRPNSETPALVDAINQLFAEFALVYHNQFQKAFPDREKLNYAKRLWASHLSSYTPEQILSACRQVVRESEYLPTVRGLLKHLESQTLGLPDAREAYVEACMKPSPKLAQRWSHPAVYLAAQAAGWHLLASETERAAFPVFERHYKQLCERAARGEALALPNLPALPQEVHHPLSPEQSAEKRKDLLNSVQ